MNVEIKVTYKNDRLKALRTAAGLSQSQLAMTAGLNVRMIQYYEQGAKDVNAAKLQTLLKLCNALNCDLRDIITEPETRKLLDLYETKGKGCHE